MSNILDYAEKYATVSCNDIPYNELDGLVLSELAYIHWESVVPGLGESTQITLREAISLLKENNPDYYESLDEKFKRLLNGIDDNKNGLNVRYGSMVISNCYAPKNTTRSDVTSNEDIRQFAAVTFSFEDHSGTTQNVIIYRGTDCTLEGWEEDFNMAFDLHTEAQKTAKDYLNTVGSNLKGDLILAGHSKGGNNAAYSYLYCDDAIRDRIVRIQSYDGPGLPLETTQNENYSKMRNLMDGNSFAPYDSVIGMLLSENSFVFVDTNDVIFKDHDAFTWQIDLDNASFVYREQSFGSKALNKALDNYILSLPQESRKLLVNSLFDFIHSDAIKDYDGDGKDFDDVLKYVGDQGIAVLVDIWYADIPVYDKIMIYSAIIVAIPVTFASFVEVTVEEFADWVISCGEAIVIIIENKINDFVNWSIEEMQHFKSCIQEALMNAKNTITNFFNQYFNNGYKYANNNPEIKVDTYKLTAYAGRLQAVNRRLSNLDSRIDKLYWKVGLLDLLKLMKSDYKIGYSSRINSCANYLYNTASDFNNAEQSIANNL